MRHRWVLWLLGVQTALLPVFALYRGQSLSAGLEEAAIPVVLTLLAMSPRLGRTARSAFAGAGLMVVSQAIVHISGGMIEAHFHFFIMIPIVAMYESWVPFGVASSIVLFHHGVMGTFANAAVYNHEAGIAHPWRWAGIHAGMFAAACIGAMVNWKLHERARDVERTLTDALSHQAHHDALTTLPNRVVLLERGEAAVVRARATRSPLSVLMLDLDGFKDVNDTLGHSWGDDLLRQVGHRLTDRLRDADVVARLGGDEFAVLLSTADLAEAQRVAERLLDALAESFDVAGIALEVGGSVGIAVLGPDDEGDLDINALLRRADVAMYSAKNGRDGIVAYCAEQDEGNRLRLTLLSDLRRAVEDDQLVLHFQPTITVRTGQVVGAEALVRWVHPEQGLLMPDQFIPAAEGTTLILPLTRRVLDLALAQARRWRDAGHPLTVAVNISPRCLLDESLPTQVCAGLVEHGLPADSLRLELTESTLMTDPDRALDVLRELAAIGVGLSIDDFGTGYSSMAYLRRLPVDEIKVDQVFVAGMASDRARGSDTGDSMIVRSTVELGHSLGLSVVAEGVEDQAVLSELALLGVDRAQGFHIARPLAADDFMTWMRDRASAGDTRHPHEERTLTAVPLPR
ncbi:MAG: putative bifunctional diguanylate cyclase/phosphodiesterase [Actinomycetes bacterium]